jgi:hypothetical protein
MAAHRQPPLIAKPSTAPAVQMDGRVGWPPTTWAWVSMTGVRSMPVSAMARSVARKRFVQRSGESTRFQVRPIHTVSTAK